MRFIPMNYLEFAKLHSRAEVNLCRSAAPDCLLEDLPVGREELEISGDLVYGYAPLARAVAGKYGLSENFVLCVNGSSQAIYFVCAALLEPGDAVLVEKPTYEPLLAVPRHFGAEVLRFGRTWENRFGIDLEEFASLLTDRVKLAIISNLHNPTGARLPRSVLQEMAAVAARTGTFLFVDEIYLDFVEGEEGRSSFDPDKNIIVTSSLSKVYGLGGLRCGWVIAQPNLILRLQTVMDYAANEVVFISALIAARLFPHLHRLKERNKSLLEVNRGIVRDFMDGEPRLSWVEPECGTICFPRLDVSLGSDDLAFALREKYDTSIVPGNYFEEPCHFRLGFGISGPLLIRGLENIRRILRDY